MEKLDNMNILNILIRGKSLAMVNLYNNQNILKCKNVLKINSLNIITIYNIVEIINCQNILII